MDQGSTHLKITAKFIPNRVTISEKTRMKWTVRNTSKEEVHVIGYSCSFYYKGGHMGVYIAQIGAWIGKEQMISNNHIITVLRPEEYRTYIWEFVPPQYYGITELGKWSYKLKIYYEVFGKSGRFISEAKPAIVELVNLKDRTRELMFYKLLSEDWQSILDNLKGVALKIPYLSGKHLNCHVQKTFSTELGPVDYLVSCESLTILTEIKLKRITPGIIKKLIKKRKWYIETYQPFVSKGAKEIWGLMICPDASRGAIREASSNQIQVVIASLENGEPALRPMTE